MEQSETHRADPSFTLNEKYKRWVLLRSTHPTRFEFVNISSPMHHVTPAWQSVRDAFTPDGSLRDIYVLETDEATWSQFLIGLHASKYPCTFAHGDRTMPRFITQAKEAFALQQTDPVLVKIMAGTIQINGHFFTPDEIELDFDPRDVADDSNYQDLLAFLQWLSSELGKPAVVTFENCENETIIQVTPDC